MKTLNLFFLTHFFDKPYKKNWPIIKDLLTPEKIYFRPDSGGLVLVGTGDKGDFVNNVDEITEDVATYFC